jgi:hypothetical protein
MLEVEGTNYYNVDIKSIPSQRNKQKFSTLIGADYRLTHLELHGNKLVSRKHVILCLSGCVNLRQLTLDVDSAPNPLCNQMHTICINFSFIV